MELNVARKNGVGEVVVVELMFNLSIDLKEKIQLNDAKMKLFLKRRLLFRDISHLFHKKMEE